MFQSGRISNVVVPTVSAVLAAVFITILWQRKRKPDVRMPDKWRRVGELVELSVYPLKSGAALNLEEAECTDIGVQTTDEHGPKLRDRFFIVVTDAGVMKTARQHPKLFFINVSRSQDGAFTFKAPDKNDLTINVPDGSPEKKNFFRMWMEEDVEAVDCGEEAAEWLHSYLGLQENEKVRLGYYHEDYIQRRDCNKKPWITFRKHYRNIRRFDTGAYSDMAPFLLINETSVEDLNKRVPPDQGHVTPSWFRPNFVVRGPDALVEDTWNFIKIGDSAVFQYLKPCLRCIMTTMHPETAVKNRDMQPLRTLRKYRLLSDPKLKGLEGELSPAMGCYLGMRQAGTVRVGDPVYVEERDR